VNIHLKQSPNRVSAAVGYSLWSQNYDRDPNPLLALETRILAGKLNDLGKKVFVDIACGTARWMVYAAQMGAHVFGADLVPEMLAAARQKPRTAGRLIQADACHLPFVDNFADIALCSFALGYLRDPECVFRELGRITKRRGMVIASDLHPEALEAGWRRTFRCGSTLLEIENYSHSCEQLVHAGSSANLELREVLQPCFDSPEITIMRDAGKTEQIQEVLKVPAILVLLWERH